MRTAAMRGGMMLDSILVGTDFSRMAGHALRRAGLLPGGRDNASTLRIAHVLQQSWLQSLRTLLDDGRPEVEERIRHSSTSRLSDVADRLRRSATRQVETVVLDGEPPAALIAEAERVGSTLIVVGGQGQHALRRIFLGSVSERVVVLAPVPVLVVKRPARDEYRCVVVPVDPGTPAEAAVAAARAIAPRARIILLHAFEVPFEMQLRHAGVDENDVLHYRDLAHQEALAGLLALRERLGPSAADIAVSALRGPAPHTILAAETSLSPELIVMPRHASGRIEAWLIGSVTQRVLEQSRCDMLVLPPPAA